MSINVVCECGKKFQAKDEYEGRRGICPSCKREFVFQAAGLPVFEALPVSAPIIPPIQVGDDIDQSQPEPKPEDPPSRPFWKDPIVVIGAAVPLTILALFFGYLYYEHRTKDFHRRVYALKQEVDGLLKSGLNRAAFTKCEEILAAIGDRDACDAKMRGYADVATKVRDRLYPQVRDEIEREARAKRAQAERDRLAVEKQARAERLVAEFKAEAEKLSQFQSDISGGAWLTNKLGQSSITRGMHVYVLRAIVPKSELSDLFERSKNRAILRRSATETGITAVTGNDQLSAARYIREAKFIEEQAESAVSIPEQQPVDTKFVYNVIRMTALGGEMARVVDEELWPIVVDRLKVSEATTDIDGKYRVGDLKGGRYYVYALFTTERAAAEWLKPITIDSPAGVSCDLYNETAATIVNKSD